jgi:hypothetical protein
MAPARLLWWCVRQSSAASNSWCAVHAGDVALPPPLQADTGNHLIRRITLSSGFVAALAGATASRGYADGVGSVALFGGPQGVVLDSNGTVAYVVRSEQQGGEGEGGPHPRAVCSTWSTRGAAPPPPPRRPAPPPPPPPPPAGGGEGPRRAHLPAV